MSTMTVPLPAERVRCRATFSEFDGLRIVIPGRPNSVTLKVSGSLTAAGLLIILGWLAGRGVDFLVTHDPTAFTIPTWLIPFMVMTGYALVVLIASLRMSFCREMLETDGHVLALSSRGYPFVPRGPRIYGLTKVSNLRYSPIGLGPESLAFAFDGLTIHFGRRLSEQESRRLIRTIQERVKIPNNEAEPIWIGPIEGYTGPLPINQPGWCRVSFDDIDGLRITIPGPSKVMVVIGTWFLVKMMALCVLFIFIHAREGGRTGVGVPCLMFFLMAARMLWQFLAGVGQETIRIDGFHLVISRAGEVCPRRPELVYSMDRIRNLRYSPTPPHRNWVGASREAIAFDVGDTTVRFGKKLCEADALRLIRTIKERYKIADDRDEPLAVEQL